MRTKNLFFTAVIAILALFTSSCDNRVPLISVLPYTFRFYFVDENGNYLINENNIEQVKNNISINYDEYTIKLNEESESLKSFWASKGYNGQGYQLAFGSWVNDNFNGTFTINYGDGTSDQITYSAKNYNDWDGKTSIKVSHNGKKIKSDRYSAEITMVKPADFFEKMQNAE